MGNDVPLINKLRAAARKFAQDNLEPCDEDDIRMVLDAMLEASVITTENLLDGKDKVIPFGKPLAMFHLPEPPKAA